MSLVTRSASLIALAAMLLKILRASSRVSNFAADRAGVQFLDCPRRREAGLRLNAKRSPEFNGK